MSCVFHFFHCCIKIILNNNTVDPRLSGSRTEIIARAYNDLRMRVVAVDNKIIVYMAAKSVVLSTEDLQVVGQGCLPLSSTRSSTYSQQLALLALFTATGKGKWPIISLIRHGFPTTLAKGVRIIEGPLYACPHDDRRPCVTLGKGSSTGSQQSPGSSQQSRGSQQVVAS